MSTKTSSKKTSAEASRTLVSKVASSATPSSWRASAKCIEFAMHKRGITQTQLAARVGVSQKTIQRGLLGEICLWRRPLTRQILKALHAESPLIPEEIAHLERYTGLLNIAALVNPPAGDNSASGRDIAPTLELVSEPSPQPTIPTDVVKRVKDIAWDVVAMGLPSSHRAYIDIIASAERKHPIEVVIRVCASSIRGGVNNHGCVSHPVAEGDAKCEKSSPGVHGNVNPLREEVPSEFDPYDGISPADRSPSEELAGRGGAA